MKTIWHTIQLFFTTLGGFIGWFLGGFDGFMYALVVFVIVDYITGVMCAVIDKELSSKVGFKGIFKKILIFAMVGVGHLLDTSIIGQGSIIRTATICFYLSNEGVSLVENASYIGLPVPDKLKNILVQLHKKDDSGEK